MDVVDDEDEIDEDELFMIQRNQHNNCMLVFTQIMLVLANELNDAATVQSRSSQGTLIKRQRSKTEAMEKELWTCYFRRAYRMPREQFRLLFRELSLSPHMRHGKRNGPNGRIMADL